MIATLALGISVDVLVQSALIMYLAVLVTLSVLRASPCIQACKTSGALSASDASTYLLQQLEHALALRY